VLGGLGLGAGVLLACGACGKDQLGEAAYWTEYHTLVAAWTSAAGALLALGIAGRRLRLVSHDATPGASPFLWKVSTAATGPWLLPERAVQGWVTVLGFGPLLLSVLYAHADLDGVWWYFASLAAIGAMAGAVAVWGRQTAYVFISGLMLNVIGTIAWWHWGRTSQVPLATLVEANAICLAAAAALWTILELLPSVRVPRVETVGPPLEFAHLAAQAAVVLLVGVVGGLVTRELLEFSRISMHRFDWISLVVPVAAMVIALWDRRARFPLAGLYFLGLAAMGMGWVERGFRPAEFFVWALVCEAAGFVLAAGAVGWALPRMPRTRALLRIPDEPERWPTAWFTWVQALLFAVAAVLTVWTSMSFSVDRWGADCAVFGLMGRLAGPPAALMLIGAAIVMAWQTAGERRAGWQYAAFAAGLLFSSSIGWAALDANGNLPWLHRSVNLVVSSAMMTLLTGLGLAKIFPTATDWIERGRRSVPWLGGLSLAALVLVLLQEAALVGRSDLVVATWAVLVVAAALAGLAAASIVFAVMPGRDPFDLTQRGRTAYVYVAEALVGILCLHFGLTRPEWFRLGIVEQYWMLIVMAVAFGGEGLAEFFQRRKLPVLSEPLERTALALPLVPAVGFWFESFFGHLPDAVFGLSYASPAMWLIVGLFYGVMAARKQSVALGGLAIVAANMGLWVLWHRLDLDFLNHPQLWLIPLALAVLVAEQLDRKRLEPSQRATIRYLALSVIYLSSTFEFMQGIGQSIFPTLVTVALAVVGVLAGILLRIRSFLYLGFTCLLVVIVRVIYYGAIQQGQMWLLWSCLILLGVAIIALFAVFEKRRNDVLAAVERFKEWRE